MTRSERATRRALVTGVAGFTGRHMAARLIEAGYEVWGTVMPSRGGVMGSDPERLLHHAAMPEVVQVSVDLLDSDGLARVAAQIRPDVVVHLAGVAHVMNGDVANTHLVNVIGTRNLLAALDSVGAPPHAVLLASSANVYGNVDVDAIDERIAPQPANDYAVSKLSMEYTAKLWSARLPVVIARPFNYTGVGQSEAYLLPKIVGHFARRERSISLGNTNVSRDFSDVRDVVAAYARLLEIAPAGDTFNICSGVGHSLADVLDMLARIAGYEIDVHVDPRFVRTNDVQRLVGSNAKLRCAVGGHRVTPLEATLRWMYDAVRSR